MRLDIKTGLVLSVIIFIMFGCEPEEVTLENKYVLFKNSIQISIPEYTYKEGDLVFPVGGDSSSKYNIVDTLSDTPVFQWKESSATFLMAAIFSDSIKVDEYNILNPGGIIWRWNTGMDFGSNGKVLFTEGRNVANDTIVNTAPNPLVTGDYYFAVWGWTTEAKKIAYSSSQMHFYVKN